MKEIELEIDAHTDQIGQLEADLSDPDVYKDGERVKTTGQQLARLRATVAALETEWTTLAEKVGD